MITITRTPWVDDDGTGTTGTVINNAVKTALYNEIDGALAKVAQLTGGNTLSGSQVIAGDVTINASTVSVANTVGLLQVNFRNPLAGPNNSVELSLGNDVQPRGFIIQTFASTYASSGVFQANGTTIMTQGVGGLSIGPFDSAPLRFFTNGVERMRVAATGELLVNTANSVGGAHVTVAVDSVVYPVGIAVQSTNVANTLFYAAFYNSTGATAGYILQTGAASVQYATTSDARLKDDAGRASDLSALRAVVVHDFAWKADGVRDRGIFAQEAHALFPRAVSPGDDTTTASGDLARPWMTDYSKFVADLIVGWQQHDAEIADLRAHLATLKGSH